MNKKPLLFIILISLLVLPLVFADSHLPEGILKAKEYNKNLAQDILIKVSLFIAFLAGMTSILSPCILPILPAYFAVTFKERRKITLATTFFFIGFTVIFILMGLLATLTGKTLITVFEGINWIIPIAGIFLIMLGVMTILGKGFAGFSVGKRIKSKNDWKGLVAFGSVFALGWTACIGPILSGVLLMAATFQNYGTASLLMLFYALGIFFPFFVLSFFYDKLHLEKLPFFNKKINFNIGKNEFYATYPGIIAGLLFVLLGFVFIIFKGTWIINGLQMFGLRQNFYSWQNSFLDKAVMFNRLGTVILIMFVGLLIYFLRKEIKRK
tara:strand:+ start:369 stop:1343 length:975 start_codon:yes stop_codon:yes gene_type:complete